jgi:hypothetical protein
LLRAPIWSAYKQGETHMSTRIRIALAAALVLASASATLARTAGHTHDVPPGWSGGGFAPGSQAEANWFRRASRPNNH